MAITFVNKGKWGGGSGTISPGLPASMQSGDLCLMFIESANEAISITTAGSITWTECTNSPQSTGTAASAGGVRLAVYYGWFTSGTTAPTIADSGNHTTGIIMAFRGVDSTTPFDATPVGGVDATATTAISTPAITTQTAGAMVVNGIGLDQDVNNASYTGGANANLTDFTVQHYQTIKQGVGGGLAVFTGVKDTAGSTGNSTATKTGTGASSTTAYLTIALRPVSSQTYDETGKNQVITAVITKTDSVSKTYSELGKSQAILAITTESDNLDGWSLERKVNTGEYSEIAVLNKSVLTYQDSSVTNGNTYYYRIRPIVNGVYGDYSNEASVTYSGSATYDETGKNQIVLATASRTDNQTKNETGKNQTILAVVEKTDSITYPIGFHILRKIGDGAWLRIDTISGSASTYVDSSITFENGVTYHYQVSKSTDGTDFSISNEADVLFTVTGSTYNELGLNQVITAVSTKTDNLINTEIGHNQIILTVLTKADTQNYAELQKAETILAVLSRADSLKCGEAGKTQVALIVQARSDGMIHSDLAKAQIILTNQAKTENLYYSDLGNSQIVITISGKSDLSIYKEVEPQVILVNTTKQDLVTLNNLGLTQVIKAIVDGFTEVKFTYNEIGLNQVIKANLEEKDSVKYLNTVSQIGKIITSGYSSCAFNEQESTEIKATIFRIDTQKYSELYKSEIILSVISKTESLKLGEIQTQVIFVVTDGTDSFTIGFDTYNELGLSQNIKAIVERSDKQTYADLRHEEVILSVIGKTESLTYPENLEEATLAITTKTDIHVNNELTHNQIVIAISGETDEFTSVYDVFDELGLTQIIIVNNSIIATLNHAETKKNQIINAVISKTESISYTETGKNQVILVTQAKADKMAFRDTSKSQVITTVLTKVDNQSYFSNTGQLILSIQSRIDNQIYNEIGKNQILLATQFLTDSFYVGYDEYNEIGLFQVINAVTGRNDNLRHGETLNQVILAVTGKNESLILPETSHAQTILAVTAKTDYLTYRETGLSQIILATASRQDNLIITETRSQVILTTMEETDRQTYSEIGRPQIIAVASEITSYGYANDIRIQVINAVTSGKDTVKYSNLGNTQTIHAITGGTDSYSGREDILAQTVRAVVTRKDTQIYDETGLSQVIMVVTTKTESLNNNELGKNKVILAVLTKNEGSIFEDLSGEQVVSAVIGKVDQQIYNSLGKNQIINAITIEQDSLNANSIGNQVIYFETSGIDIFIHFELEHSSVIKVITEGADTYTGGDEITVQILRSIITKTDNQIHDEIGLSQTILARVTKSESLVYDEPGLSQTINAVIASQHNLVYTEIPNQPILVTAYGVDTQILSEDVKTQVILASVTKYENIVFEDTSKTQVIYVIQFSTDSFFVGYDEYNELGFTQLIRVVTDGTDSFTSVYDEYNEIGLSQIINVLLSLESTAIFYNSGTQIIRATTSGKDSSSGGEEILSQILQAIVTKAESQVYDETGLSQVIIANVVETDVYICSQDLGLTQVALLIPTEQDNQSCVEYARNQTIETRQEIVDILINNEIVDMTILFIDFGTHSYFINELNGQIIQVIGENYDNQTMQETLQVIIQVELEEIDEWLKALHDIYDETGLEQIIKVVLEKVAGFAFDETGEIIIKVQTTFNLDAFEKVAHLEGELANIILEGELADIVLEGEIVIIMLEGDT